MSMSPAQNIQKTFLKVAIVGKPNVGKSSLFNKLCGRKFAIVHDQPGITRDRREYLANLGDISFIAVDTAGWEDEAPDALRRDACSQSLLGAQVADVIMFVVDGKWGLSTEDIEFAKRIRKLESGRVILVVNKSESTIVVDKNDLYKLGLGDPVYISVTQRLGFDSLYVAMQNILPQFEEGGSDIMGLDEAIPENGSKAKIEIAFVGRPNVGKSTLFNQILGAERAIVSDIPGTTRDCISDSLKLDDSCMELIDTAGIRKKAKVDGVIENYCVGQSITAIKRANVVVLVMDARTAFEKQDMAIARIVINEGKAIVLVINKIDLVEDVKLFKENAKRCLEAYFTDVCDIPVLYISALHNQNIQQLVRRIKDTFVLWGKECSTGELNRWLKIATESHSPPLSNNGRRIKIKYVTQVAKGPPTLCLFANIPEDLPRSYQRYLKRSFASHFLLSGIPVRFIFNKGSNPYASK